MVAQLVQLERETSRAGKDSISHPKGQHDDIANVVCGCLVQMNSGPQTLIVPASVVARGRRFPPPNPHGL
jgi:hypothetical protein